MDAQISQSAKATTSVESLYHSHQSWLQGWLRRRLGDSFDAADMAQDVFMRLLTRQPALTQPACASPAPT